MIKKKLLGFWDIWNMSFGFWYTIWFWYLRWIHDKNFSNIRGQKMKFLCCGLAAPLTGLIVQPIVGYMSDRTWSVRWGRRRPYFLVGSSILSSITLFFVPTLNIYGW